MLTYISFWNKVVADPSHRRRTVTNWYFVLVNQPVNVCALNVDQAKKLSKNFGYFQNQIKEMLTEEAEVYKNVPMHHIVGDHDG